MANCLLDTGPLVALLNRDERLHAECVHFLKNFKGKFLSTESILTESLYLLGDSFQNQKRGFEFILEAVQVVPSSPSSLKRCFLLMEKYQDTPMDFADATLVVLAEETQINEIFTLDRRGFETYRWGRNKSFIIYPE